MSLLIALLVAGCSSPDGGGDEAAVTDYATPARSALEQDVCDSSRHESTEVDVVYTFELACAVDWLAEQGCRFDLDPNGDGEAISSSSIEDLFDAPGSCQSGSRCSGCDDGEGLATVTTCTELAATAYFTASEWADLQAVCPVAGSTSCTGGSWSEGAVEVSLDGDEECTILEIANWATRGQLTEVTLHDGPVTPSAGLSPLQATGILQRATSVAYTRDYGTIDEVLAQPGVGIGAIATLKTFVPAWKASGRMGDPTEAPEARLLAFVGDEGVDVDELDFVDHVSTAAAAAIVGGRPYATHADLVGVTGDEAWVQPGGALYDYAQEWYVTGAGVSELPGTGCTIEGVDFSHDEMRCAISFFTTMSCASCREVLDSRVCEDAIDDPSSCQVGDACTGCADGDSRDNGVDCAEIEAYSYFGVAAAGRLLAEVQANPCGDCAPSCAGRECGDDGCGGSCGSCAGTCDDSGRCAADGCTIEGVFFAVDEMDCALWLFETMDCATCTALFDSRVCEDALDAGCQVGSTCTGCGDGDGRADGVSCDEIAAYSYFGASAAAKLLETVRLDPTCGEPDLVVEGVTLEVAQAEAILDVANRASQAQLDDEAGLDGRAAANIVASRPLASIEDLAAVSYVGGTALGRLRDYVEVWVPPDAAPVRVTVDLLDDEAVMNGTSSTLYDALVTVERAIVTSDPWRSSSGNTSFYVADPAVGAERQLKVYLVGSTEIDASWVSIFDDVELTGRFTTYGSTFEILLDREDAHAVTLNRSGVAWEDYDRIQGAWHSTSANPEGSVRVVSTWGYTYMVPLPVFLDHPMWGGDPPGPPRDSGNEQDHNWNIAAQAALDAWR